MKKCALLMATIVLAACGNHENKSDTGDVHGDGRCTERYVNSYNELVLSPSAELCEAFKANHQVTCKLELRGQVEEVNYEKKFAPNCNKLIAARDAALKSLVPTGSTSTPTSFDTLAIRDLEPSWITVEMKDSKFASTADLTIYDGQTFATTEAFIDFTKAHPDILKEGTTVCGINNFAATDMSKTLTAKKIQPSSDRVVNIDFEGGKYIRCKTASKEGRSSDPTVGQLKKTLKGLARVEVLKR